MVEKLKIGSIVIRCYEFDKMLAFWQEAQAHAPEGHEPMTDMDIVDVADDVAGQEPGAPKKRRRRRRRTVASE